VRERLLRWLACPLCHGELELRTGAAQRQAVGPTDRAVLDATMQIDHDDEIAIDVVAGALVCAPCRVYYPIHNGIPRLLTYPTQVARVHAREQAPWIGEHLAGLSLPSSDPPPGEPGVLRTFSTEWTGYQWSGSSYWDITPETMLRAKRFELGLAKHPLKNRLVLEVGIGIGGTADALSRAEDCELVGMDLSYAVDRARHYFGTNPRLHIVQASVFAPPFRAGTFDAVYTHGVLHHTYSTRAAFSQIAGLPKPATGMLYVWLYSHEQARRTPLRRALMAVERVARPVLARLPGPVQTAFLLPTTPLYILYQNFYRRWKLGAQFTARYTWNEALHAARDRLTPPFAHRHTYEEVAAWFVAERYSRLELLRDEPRPEGIADMYTRNVGIRAFRLQDAVEPAAPLG
jgi:uncharacterized protein YbaR (Trm112 family)